MMLINPEQTELLLRMLRREFDSLHPSNIECEAEIIGLTNLLKNRLPEISEQLQDLGIQMIKDSAIPNERK